MNLNAVGGDHRFKFPATGSDQLDLVPDALELAALGKQPVLGGFDIAISRSVAIAEALHLFKLRLGKRDAIVVNGLQLLEVSQVLLEGFQLPLVQRKLLVAGLQSQLIVVGVYTHQDLPFADVLSRAEVLSDLNHAAADEWRHFRAHLSPSRAEALYADLLIPQRLNGRRKNTGDYLWAALFRRALVGGHQVHGHPHAAPK